MDSEGKGAGDFAKQHEGIERLTQGLSAGKAPQREKLLQTLLYFGIHEYLHEGTTHDSSFGAGTTLDQDSEVFRSLSQLLWLAENGLDNLPRAMKIVFGSTKEAEEEGKDLASVKKSYPALQPIHWDTSTAHKHVRPLYELWMRDQPSSRDHERCSQSISALDNQEPTWRKEVEEKIPPEHYSAQDLKRIAQTESPPKKHEGGMLRRLSQSFSRRGSGSEKEDGSPRRREKSASREQGGASPGGQGESARSNSSCSGGAASPPPEEAKDGGVTSSGSEGGSSRRRRGWSFRKSSSSSLGDGGRTPPKPPTPDKKKGDGGRRSKSGGAVTTSAGGALTLRNDTGGKFKGSASEDNMGVHIEWGASSDSGGQPDKEAWTAAAGGERKDGGEGFVVLASDSPKGPPQKKLPQGGVPPGNGEDDSDATED